MQSLLGQHFKFSKMIRVKGQCNQGGRDYMENFMEVSLNPDPEDSYFSIYDGHGGQEATDLARNY